MNGNGLETGAAFTTISNNVHAERAERKANRRDAKAKAAKKLPPSRVKEPDYVAALKGLSLVSEGPQPMRCSASVLEAFKVAPDCKKPFWQRAVGKKGPAIPMYSLEDNATAGAVERLFAKYGKAPNIALLDSSYRVFLRDDKAAAVCFKVAKGVAVAFGEPLCEASEMEAVFKAFRKFCKHQRWQVVVLGGEKTLSALALKKSWPRIEFAVEQVLNPNTNPVLDGTSSKSVVSTNRTLLKNGTAFAIYKPADGIDLALESKLLNVYDRWRQDRTDRKVPEAYATVLNPFLMRSVVSYVYTKGADGEPNGFAGLVHLGAKEGYLLDPCVAEPNAPKGVTDFLTYHAMGLLRQENCSYMSFGLEPLPKINEITGMSRATQYIARYVHKKTCTALGLGGKKAFHDKWKPDEVQENPLYLIFPMRFPWLNPFRAVLAVTHVRLRQVWANRHRKAQ